MLKKKNNKSKNLTTAQKNKLKDHAKHHTSKHMTLMKAHMKSGKSFTEAHKIAMRSVGK